MRFRPRVYHAIQMKRMGHELPCHKTSTAMQTTPGGSSTRTQSFQRSGIILISGGSVSWFISLNYFPALSLVLRS
ncbi:hypothetical protein ACROYT_G002682 [Oculina patagonica]